MKRTYQGRCHCGAVRYEVDADLEAGTGRCNCTVCVARRIWGAQVKPQDFRLLSPEDNAADYTLGGGHIHHRFCKACGVSAYYHGDIPQMGGAFVTVAVTSLQGLAPEQLAALPIRYFDGLRNNWWNEPDVKSYL